MKVTDRKLGWMPRTPDEALPRPVYEFFLEGLIFVACVEPNPPLELLGTQVRKIVCETTGAVLGLAKSPEDATDMVWAYASKVCPLPPDPNESWELYEAGVLK